MLDKILQIIAPHHCYFCTYTGSILCNSCIYNIVESAQNECISCKKPTTIGVCGYCRLPFLKAWVVGEREGQLAKLIGDFKWARTYEAYRPLGGLLHEILPILPETTVVVPIPTIPRHIRIRGYDHANLLATSLARRRGLSKQNLLRRNTNYIQHKANKTQRTQQAESAFRCDKKLDPDIPYLIVDDIITTGATIKAATRVLKGAGANEVWVAAIARQPFRSNSEL